MRCNVEFLMLSRKSTFTICQKNNCYRSTTLLFGLGWAIDQTPRFSISQSSVWGIAQKRNLGVEETQSLIKMREVTQFSKKIVVRVNLRENSEVFNSEFSVLGIEQNGKLGVENLGKLIL